MHIYELFEDLYHGSPYDFDKFSTNNIGSGEGAASYGWGLYFASNEDIADFYRAKLTRSYDTENDETPDIVIDGKVVLASTPINKLSPLEIAAIYYMSARRNTSQAIEELESMLKWSGTNKKNDEEAIKILQTTDLSKRVKRWRGAFYHVEVPDENTYLLWEFPQAHFQEV